MRLQSAMQSTGDHNSWHWGRMITPLTRPPPLSGITMEFTTWQVSRKTRGLGRAPRAPNLHSFVVNLRTLPNRIGKKLITGAIARSPNRPIT